MQFNEQEVARLRLVLKHVSFLEHLKINEMDTLIRHVQKRPFAAGEIIIKQGGKADSFYLLASGKVGVYLDSFFSRKKIATLGPDSFFGEMALITHSIRSATVIGEVPGDLYSMSREDFDGILLKNPEIAEIIRRTASQRKGENMEKGGG